MLESAVDRFGRAIAGAGAIEVGKDVRGSLLQGPSQGDELGQGGRDAVAQRGDELGHDLVAAGSVRIAVGGDHALVDAPGGLDLDVLLDVEQAGQPLALAVGEQVSASVLSPAGAIERVVGAAAVTVQILLDPATAPVQGVAGETHDVEGVHDRGRVRQFLGGGGLETGEPVHRDDLQALAPRLRPVGQPRLERLLGAARDHVQQPGGTGAVADRGQVDDRR